MRLLKTMLACLIVLNASQLQAQPLKQFTLLGTIKDFRTKEPVLFSSVFIERTGEGTISDSLGNFKLDNLTEGSLEVTISAMGYESLVKTVVINNNLPITKSHFFLKEKALELNEFSIQEVSRETEIELKGFAVDAIETKEIKTQSIQLNDLLDKTAGIRVRQSGGMGSRTTYNVNGLSGNAIRFFLDGVPMEFYGSSYSINNVPVALIERMEVYKGVVPVSLGNDALGGAVNIVTKSSATNSLNYSYSFGSFNTHQTLLNGNWRHAKTGLSAKASLFYNYSDNNYKIWGDNVYVTDPNTFEIKRGLKVKRFHDGYSSIGSKVALGFTDKPWADQLYLGLLYAQMNKDSQHGATMDIPYGERTYYQKTLMPNIAYLKKNFLLNGLTVNLFAGYSQQKRNLIDTSSNQYNWYGEVISIKPGKGEHAGATLSETHEKTYINRVNLAYQLNTNNEFGINYLLSDFEREGDDPIAPPERREFGDLQKLKKDIVGVSYQNIWLNTRLTSTLFAKYYHYAINVVDAVYENARYIPYNKEKSDHNLGYGLAISFSIFPEFTFLSSFENATRLPETNEIFGNDSENINPAYELSPEKSNNINLGFRLGPLSIRNHSFTINNNLFYRNVKDLIQQANIEGAIDSYVFINLEKILSKGVDLDFKYSYKKTLDLNFGASYTDARDVTLVDSKGRKNRHYQARIPNQPFLQFNNGVKYNFNHLIQKEDMVFVYWNSNYVYKFFRKWANIGKDNKDIIPTQFVHHLGLGYTFPNKRLTLTVDAKNIFNEQVYDNFAIQQPGRAFYAKLNYNLVKKN